MVDQERYAPNRSGVFKVNPLTVAARCTKCGFELLYISSRPRVPCAGPDSCPNAAYPRSAF